MKKEINSIKKLFDDNPLIYRGIGVWVLVLTFCCLPLITKGSKSNYSYIMSLENFEQVSESEFQFDIWLHNTGSGFCLDFLIVGLEFNPNLNSPYGEINNHGLIYINGTSELLYPPEGFYLAHSGNRLIVESGFPNWWDSVQYLEAEQKVRIGRFSVSVQYDERGGVFLSRNLGLRIYEAGTLVQACNIEPDGTRGFIDGVPIESGSYESIIPDPTLAGFFFTGDGEWHARDKDGGYTHWNTHEETHPDLARRLPGVNDAVVIAGHAVIGPGKAVELTANGEGEGGVLRISNSLSSSLRVSAGASLTVDKLLNDHQDEGAVILESGSGEEVSGSLIHGNEATPATVEVHIARWSPDEPYRGWHMISSPVADMPIRPEFVPEGQIPVWIDFYKWDEAHVAEAGGREVTGWWINSKRPGGVWNDDFETGFLPGRGYLLAYGQPDKENLSHNQLTRFLEEKNYEPYGNKPHVFTGELNVADYPVGGLGRADSGTYAGWHLLGNPFPSAIDWTLGDWDRHNIIGGPVIWREEYASYSPVLDIIPAMNGFMIQTSGNGSLKIPAGSRVHDATPWYKSEAKPGTHSLIRLTAHDPAGKTAQETLVRFLPDATAQFDTLYDTPYMAGYAPEFYSLAGDIPVSLNSLPETGHETEIPLAFLSNSSRKASFFIELNHAPHGMPLYLEDHQTGTIHCFGEEGAYHFTADPSDPPHRFVLHAGKDLPTGTAATGETTCVDPRAWRYDDILYVETNRADITVEVIDLMGRVILKKQLSGAGTHQLGFRQKPGVYVVRITTPKGIYTTRI